MLGDSGGLSVSAVSGYEERGYEDRMEIPSRLWIIGGALLIAIILSVCGLISKDKREKCILYAHILVNIGLIIWGEPMAWYCFMMFLLYGLLLAIGKGIENHLGRNWCRALHVIFSLLLLIKAFPYILLAIFILYINSMTTFAFIG